MSSPDIESPFSAYSYAGEVRLSPPQDEASRSPQNTSNDSRLPPRIRFRSPELFQHILSDAGPVAQGFHGQSIDYEETMNDVNRALLSANRAIQNAQEAFQSRRSLSRNTQNQTQEVVDLTGNSPPSSHSQLPPAPPPPPPLPTTDEAAYDAFLSRLIHPRDPGPRYPASRIPFGGSSHGAPSPPMDDPTSRYSGPDSLAGPRRRYQDQRSFHLETHHVMLQRGQQRTTDARAEEAAVRRQHRARAQWAQNQRRTNERLRLEEQRQRILRSPVSSRATQPATMQSQSTNQNRPGSSSAGSTSSVEAVDLTSVDDNPTLAAALAKQRQDAITSQNDSSQAKSSNSGIGDGVGRTALTAYKCPICMEPPQNATTTSCGHLFCHKCIIDTLKWSEQARRDEVPPSRKVRGVCPVCRKELARNEEPGARRTLIPLEIRLISKKELKRKREEEERKAKPEKKGKEKIYDIGDLIDNDDDDGADSKANIGGSSGSNSSQKENRDEKRIKPLTEHYYSGKFDDLFDFDYDHDFL